MMDAASDISKQNQPLKANSGIDIFYAMLMSPVKTLSCLSSETSAGLLPLLAPILIVSLAALADGASTISSIRPLAIALNMFGSFIEMMFFWFVLMLFLLLLAAFLKQQVSLRSCYLVTGWAFIPLIFKGVTTCFSNATVFGDMLSLGLSIWFLLLELFAFDSVLKLGRFKTLGIILLLPPCLFFAYFISMMFASVIISHDVF